MKNIVPMISLPLLLACTNDSSDTSNSDTQTGNPEESWASSYYGELNSLVASSEEMATLNQLEDKVDAIESDIAQPWVAAWKNGEVDAYRALFTADGSGVSWNEGQVTVNRDTQGIVEASVNYTAGTDTTAEMLSNTARIHDFQLVSTHIESESETSATITMSFDLRSEMTDGSRQQNRGHVTLTCVKSDQWKIQSLSTSDFERLTSTRGPAFVDKTSALNLDTLPITDRKEAIRRGGYALVVSDYDQDGLKDMLVGNYGPINLLRNTGNGYEDVTTAAGLDPEEVIKGAGFVDMDNDGDRDLVLLRFTDADDPRGDFVIYENDGDGTFTKHTDLLPRRRSYDTPMPLSMGDYNNDGWIDIYIGFPGVRDFTSGISASERPEWQASQGIWFNKGNWTFEEAPDDNGVVADNSTYSHAAASTDLDGDGWIDLLVVDDSGRINPVFRNSGSGNFEPIGEEAGLNYTGMSMGVTTGDFNNDGLLDIMSSHVAMDAGMRMAYSMDGLLPEDSTLNAVLSHTRDKYVDMQLFTNNGDGTFTDSTATANLNWAGEAAGAGEWLDYNHDGLLDYYLPNGLWSGGEDSIDSVFFRAEMMLYGVALLGDDTVERVPFNIMNDVSGGPIFSKSDEGGANPVLTLLRNYRKEANGPLSLSFAGHSRNALFRNNGDGTFTEVGFLEGVDRIEDGYIVAPVDINNDGLQDLVLRNTDPAKERSFQPVIALENQLEGNTLSVKLHSDSGNTDGLGARVTVRIGEQIISREIRSVTGAVQSEPVAYFGLGTADRVDSVTVTWPGGVQQVQENVAMGTLVIEKQ